jgi:hypothetical protein
MLKIDNNLLAELGLASLPDQEKEQLKAQIYRSLQERVGLTLSSKMTEAQLLEFETIYKQNDQAAAVQWLETNYPNYKQVVADELEKLKGEIKAVAPQILASSPGINSGMGAGGQQAPGLQQPGAYQQQQPGYPQGYGQSQQNMQPQQPAGGQQPSQTQYNQQYGMPQSPQQGHQPQPSAQAGFGYGSPQSQAGNPQSQQMQPQQGQPQQGQPQQGHQQTQSPQQPPQGGQAPGVPQQAHYQHMTNQSQQQSQNFGQPQPSQQSQPGSGGGQQSAGDSSQPGQSTTSNDNQQQ